MITYDDVLLWHENSIRDFGGSQGIRDKGMLESALQRPYSTFGGEILYPTPFLQAASILESILKNHPFIDGNKRTAWIACVTLLLKAEIDLTLTPSEAYDFVIKVATSHLELEDVALYLKLHSTSL